MKKGAIFYGDLGFNQQGGGGVSFGLVVKEGLAQATESGAVCPTPIWTWHLAIMDLDLDHPPVLASKLTTFQGNLLKTTKPHKFRQDKPIQLGSEIS